jgi:hypothetical protein
LLLVREDRSLPAPQLTVGPLTDADLAAVIDLTAAQEARWHEGDSRLERPRDRQELAAQLVAQHRDAQAEFLVARDAAGRARGYAQPALFELESDSDLLAYFTARNGTCERLVLPTPDEDDASAVLSALFAALTMHWQQRHSRSPGLAPTPGWSRCSTRQASRPRMS